MATDKAPSAYGRAVKAQFDAANPAHPAWVSANAGSGKTKVLIDRVARLLLKKASPDSILCITYTKAAANEMLQRLFDRLGAWSVMGEAALRDQLGRLEGRAAETYTSDEIANARALFARAVETPGGLRIETIHAFCARVLRRFPLEADLAPGFEEIDDAEAAVLWEQAVIAGLKALDAAAPEDLDCVALAGGGRGASSGLQAIGSALPLFTQYLETAETLEAIEADLRRVLSPPEANEETLIARAMGEQMPVTDLKRVIALLKSNSAKSSATLANKLTGVLEARDPQRRWALYQSVFFTTTGDFRKSILVKAVAADLEAGALLRTDDIPEGSEVLRIKALDAALKARRAYDRTRALLRLAQPVIATYQQLKRARARVDFDDLIANTADLLTRRAAADWVLYKLDGQLTHVLLDEAQDTSPQQWTLLNALTAEFFAGEGTEKDQALRTLFVVGDEKQSIYSFQGADPQRFLTERQDFESRARSALGEAWLPNMEMSFRSSPEILSFVDTVSASGSVSGHPYVDGPVGDLDLMRHTAHRADQPGLVELWPIEVPDPQTEAIPWDAPRDEESADSPRNRLAVQVAQAVREMIDRGETVWDKGARRPVTAGDVLILVQNRSGGLFDGLIAALKAEKLPVAGADRLVLADHIGVQDCLNLMRFVLLPEDDLVVAEILRGPFGGLVDDNRHLFPLAYDRGEASLWARLKASTVSEHQAVAAFLERLLDQRDEPPFEFLSRVLERPGPGGTTGWETLTLRLGASVRDPVSALLAKAMAHDARGASSLQTFVCDMDLDRSQIKRDLAAPNGNIRVMTVHGAKGLQAPVVILPDLTRAPQSQSRAVLAVEGVPVWLGAARDDTAVMMTAREDAKARDEREHRRLLYVALTRAEDRLILCGAWHGQRPKPDKPPPKGFPDQSWYALCDEAIRHLCGETAEPDGVWRYGSPAALAPPSAGAVGVPSTGPDWLARLAPDELATGRIAAASGLVPDQTPVVPPATGTRSDRLKRGRLIHALLERLPALPADRRRAAGERFLQLDPSTKDADQAEMLSAALGVIEDPRFAGVFHENGRAEAPVIGTAPDLPAGLIINGRVDRIVVTESHVLIVDFKTDRPAPARAEAVSASYLAQMAAYCAVLRAAYPGRTVEAALVWTDGPVLMPLPADLLAESLSLASVRV